MHAKLRFPSMLSALLLLMCLAGSASVLTAETSALQKPATEIRPQAGATVSAPTGGPGAAQGSAASPTSAPGAPFSAAQLSDLLPATVYFQGKTAPLQIRNAGGARFLSGAIVWVSLVDTSGYASGVQDRYQFYLVSEGPIRVGDTRLAAGAYGAGFVGDRFILMDLGGHTVAQGPVQTDADLRRPRPLEVVPDSPDSVKLYLGRRWVLLQADPRVEAR